MCWSIHRWWSQASHGTHYTISLSYWPRHLQFMYSFVLVVFFQFELMLKWILQEKKNIFEALNQMTSHFLLIKNLLLMGSCQSKLRQQKRLQIIHSHYPLFDFVHDISEKTSGNSKFAVFLLLTTSGNSYSDLIYKSRVVTNAMYLPVSRSI